MMRYLIQKEAIKMGAAFNLNEYPGTTNRVDLQDEWDGDVAQSQLQHGSTYSGKIGMLPGPLDFHRLDEVALEDEHLGDIEEYIVERHQKWTPAMAILHEGTWYVGGWCSC